MTKNQILEKYFSAKVSFDKYLRVLDNKGLSAVERIKVGQFVHAYNNELAKMEDQHKWIANVLMAMEGT